MALAPLFILKQWPILNWQPQSPFCKDMGQSLREHSLDVLGDHPQSKSPKSSFLKGPWALCSHPVCSLRAEDPPVGSPGFCPAARNSFPLYVGKPEVKP